MTHFSHIVFVEEATGIVVFLKTSMKTVQHFPSPVDNSPTGLFCVCLFTEF